MTKSKPKPVKPRLRLWAWVRSDGFILHVGKSREEACRTKLYRGERMIELVEIRPAPKRKSKRTKP